MKALKVPKCHGDPGHGYRHIHTRKCLVCVEGFWLMRGIWKVAVVHAALQCCHTQFWDISLRGGAVHFSLICAVQSSVHFRRAGGEGLRSLLEG